MSEIPNLHSHDLILLRDGEVVRLISTDYRTMIVRRNDGVVVEVKCSEYAGLLIPAKYEIDDTQPMPRVDVLVDFWNTVEQ